MSLKMINFAGADFRHAGRASRTLPTGEEVNVRYIQKVTLADGTIYQKDWPRWVWAKWIPNKNHRRFSDSHGQFRRVNERMSNLLDQAWKENFKPEQEGV